MNLKRQAIPFITYDKNYQFEINSDAEKFLNQINDEPFGVISIIGKYRTGKSFFIN